MELVDTPDLGSGAERCGGSSPPSRTTQSIAIAVFARADLHLYANLYANYPYNFFDMAAPVSRVSSALRCEYISIKSRDTCLKLPHHRLWVTPTNSSQLGTFQVKFHIIVKSTEWWYNSRYPKPTCGKPCEIYSNHFYFYNFSSLLLRHFSKGPGWDWSRKKS